MTNDKKHSTSIPNIIVWSWMRTVLNLSGSELLIFAYIFSQTFDNVHKCYTCLSDMEMWFGMSRQTISRNIDKLCARGFAEKEILQDSINPMIKHNNYKVCVEYITKVCERADYDSYSNFLDSYRFILKQKFPDDSSTIDDYLEILSTWHQNKNIKVCVTLNEIAQLISFGDDSANGDVRLSDMLNVIRSNDKISNVSTQSHSKTSSGATRKTNNLFDSVKPKRKSKKSKQLEWYTEKKNITQNFVYMRLGGNDELQELLYKFLETDNGMSYTPPQWEQQLENMLEHGRTIDRMISGVKMSYMNNYRSLYIADRSEVDMNEKFSEIEKYVSEICENNKELKDLLISYVTEVPKGKSYTIKQFKLVLDNLTNLCPTTDDKIKSVRISYANSYSALAYPKQIISSKSSTNSDSESNDIEEKLNIIKQFISDGCYYLCDGLEDNLIEYVNNTRYGRSVDASTFKTMLDNLRLFCLDDTEKVAKIKLAIQNNYSRFATEDFSETAKLRESYRSREDVAQHSDRSRKLAVYKEQQKHPNNPKICGVKIDWS